MLNFPFPGFGIVRIQQIIRQCIIGIPEIIVNTGSLVGIHDSSLFHRLRCGKCLCHLLEDIQPGFLNRIPFARNIIIFRCINTAAAHAKPGNFTLFNGIKNAGIRDLNGHKPCAFLYVLSVNLAVTFCNPVLDHRSTFHLLEVVLKINIVGILRKPTLRLFDFFRSHVVSLCVLNHRLIHDTGNVVGFAVCFQNASVCLENCSAVLCFGNQELPLVRRLIHKRHKNSFNVAHGNGFCYFVSHCRTPFFRFSVIHGTKKQQGALVPCCISDFFIKFLHFYRLRSRNCKYPK